MVEVYAWATKAAKHRDAVPFLFTLAQSAVYSQLTLSEALALARELRMLTPLMGNPQMMESWATYGVHATYVWEHRRENGKGLGDEWRNNHEIRALARWRRTQRLEHLKAQLDALQANLDEGDME